jgi:bifunctional UDP-N-acetylglucosamine pyrophosphorylase/glucosamine-1-phosphate N-acetyltransferase
MYAVILAAGEGRRMRPLSKLTPKPMLPVLDRPIAAHVADAAVAAGADELVFVVGYEADHVRAYFGDTYAGVPVSYADQGTPEGTADAVAAARPHVDGPFAVLNGDNLYDPEAISDLFDAGPAVLAHRVPNPSEYGVLSTRDGAVTDIVEKPAVPPTELANAGAYVLPPEALSWLDVPRSERGEHELTDVIARAVRTRRVAVVEADSWLDVARPLDLLAANVRYLAEIGRHAGGDPSTDASTAGDIVVRPGAAVGPGATITGPAVVCNGARIGSDALIEGAAVIGAGADVGADAHLRDAVVLPGTEVATATDLERVVVGPGHSLSAGASMAGSPPADGDRTPGGVAALTGRQTGSETGLAYAATSAAGRRTADRKRSGRDAHTPPFDA